MRFDILLGSQFTAGATLEMYCTGYFAGGVSGVGLFYADIECILYHSARAERVLVDGDGRFDHGRPTSAAM